MDSQMDRYIIEYVLAVTGHNGKTAIGVVRQPLFNSREEEGVMNIYIYICACINLSI